MNGLTLRISGNLKNKKKAAGTADIGVIQFPVEVIECLQNKSIKINEFINASTANEQLTALTKLINDQKEKEGHQNYEEFVQFLVEIYYYSKTTHPLKSFLSRLVLKQESLQKPFVTHLANKFKEQINKLVQDATHDNYVHIIGNILSCEDCKTLKITLKFIGELVLDFLSKSLHFCCTSLRSENISPTDKNKIYQLVHTTIRALLHMIQNSEPIYVNNVILMYDHMKADFIHLFHNTDVPMDTKSLSGILYLHFYILRNGPQSWTDICIEEFIDPTTESWLLLDRDLMDLILYSAIAVVVPIGQLESTVVEGKPAVLIVTEKIVTLGERNIQECTFILGVARTIVQLCGSLNRIQDGELGVRLCELHQLFVWTHVDHHLDSVRYLTTEALTVIVRFCAGLYKQGQTSALDSLLQSIISLTPARKAYFLALTELIKAVGTPTMLDKVPDLIDQLIFSLNVQHVKASASTTLEALLDNDNNHCQTHIFDKWISPILSHISRETLDQAGVKNLGNFLAKILKRDKDLIVFILPQITSSTYINTNTKLSDGELKCILVLLNVARKAGAITDAATSFYGSDWKHLVDYRVICNAALNPCDDIRLQSLYLIVETQKSTELIVQADFEFILHFLQYNMNTQSSAFRQQMMSYIHKFFKRIEDTYKIVSKSEIYNPFKSGIEKFLEDLRDVCFDSLVVGANYGRRHVCLQGLLWTEVIQLDYTRVWKEEYVHKLLIHLDDSYEYNKASSLEILLHSPQALLLSPNLSNIINIDSIMNQASAIKPTECVSAAYKLRLINKKLPQLVSDDKYSDVPEQPAYCLIRKLMDQLRKELEIAQKSVLLAASHAPMYGVLHCICQLIKDLDYKAIASNDKWSVIVDDLIQICMTVNQVVGTVVNSSSPEGHLPMDFEPGVTHLQDISQDSECSSNKMTAQRVLLCAWRSVKEVSLLLGEISNTFIIQEESSTAEGNLTEAQMLSIGGHFTTLLTETKHRGAFEQAYVGFTKLLERLWRCKVSSLHSVPSQWVRELLDIISLGQSQQKGLCGTRRSAGLPFMIQALVTVEVQVAYNPVCFTKCMETLLGLANQVAQPDCLATVEATVHSLNILRALFRHTSLSNAVSKYVESGMITAIKGFARNTWGERNSATLLLSALMVRVFGVVRSREQEVLSIRNRMTGRIFFLRYPNMYDFMLKELQNVNISDETLRPSLFPILLILARLYPSSLEGTSSNFRLSAYISHVSRCAGSNSMFIRRLASSAIVPLISHATYLSHLQDIIKIISNRNIKSNYCHGTLLMVSLLAMTHIDELVTFQIRKLLENKPEDLVVQNDCNMTIMEILHNSLWILNTAQSNSPCYLIIDEYLHIINLILWKFPTFLNEDFIHKVKYIIKIMIFDKIPPFCHPARHVCVSNAICLYLIILFIQKDKRLTDTVIASLKHDTYEVQLAILNYILILHNKLEKDNFNNFHKHWNLIIDKKLLIQLQNNKEYIKMLCDLFKNSKYMECTQKSLLLLSLEDNIERNIIEIKCQKNKMADEEIIAKYIECVENEHENLTEVYLNCLLKFVKRNLLNEEINAKIVLDVMRTMHGCSSSENNERTRFIVAKFLEENGVNIINMDFKRLSLNMKFELKSTIFVILTTLLEDDDASIRQLTTQLVVQLCDKPNTIATKASEVLRAFIANIGDDAEAILLAMSLVDFRTEVCLTDDLQDESRVFDQNEKYNVFMEESILSRNCMRTLHTIHNAKTAEHTLREKVLLIINHPIYKDTFVRLCNGNLIAFISLLSGNTELNSSGIVNPKIEIVFNCLS